MNSASYHFLGIKVHALTNNDLFKIVLKSVQHNRKTIIGYHNMHSLYVYHHDDKMSQFYKHVNYAHIDGMPLVWFGRLFGYPLTKENRLTSIDWLPSLLGQCEKEGIRVFFLGSKQGVAEKAAEYFVELNPDLQIKTHHGYFDTSLKSIENQQLIHQINEFKPHILMVGMGMPRQENWILDNVEKMDVNIIWSLGAFMDYFAGVIPTPPRWMGQVGLEWLYRLWSEPKRLWRRYLVEPWFILRLLVKELVYRK